MSFVIQRASGRGLALTQVRSDLLRIGRGTNAELRSENPAVALEHAVIETDANGFTITDKGSITGTYVNRRPVETARLARGDVIEIGDLRIGSLDGCQRCHRVGVLRRADTVEHVGETA